ncbi:hypothetical protein G7Z17_g4455 [Cylindrodendrum hubeiense]|uniref:Uncharacterized protein n=1 Tax=Cylindrodendrum hubeiense TaxID=595255 RepID=A0A9P5LIA7_9HYPO|nr:hypothetical protein G7Z17_g4455 [Cylindrodendrum hubeiense]
MRLWAAGVGALAEPDASLERRLQFQPKPRLVLISLLLTLQEFVKICRMHALDDTHGDSVDCNLEPEPESGSLTDETLDLTLDDHSDLAPSSAPRFMALNSLIDSDSNASTDSDADEESNEEHSEGTLEKAMKNTEDILDQLMMLGFAIRKSGTAARLQKADSSFNPDENMYFRTYLEFILRNNVAKGRKNEEDNRHITAEDRMRETKNGVGEVTPEQRHLILAILRRRHRFEYARRHQQRLDQVIVFPAVPKLEPSVRTPEVQKTVVPGHTYHELEQQPPTEASSSKMQSLAQQDIPYDQIMSETTPSAAQGDILEISAPLQAAPDEGVQVSLLLPDTAGNVPGLVKMECPLCSWPQDEGEVPDAAAKLEHIGNCIHEFSLNALPWAESLGVRGVDSSSSSFRQMVEEWIDKAKDSTEEENDVDIQKIRLEAFGVLSAQPPLEKQERKYIPQEFFAESSEESSQVEWGSLLSQDSDLPEVEGTNPVISDRRFEEIVENQVVLNLEHLREENEYTLGRVGRHNIVIGASAPDEYSIRPAEQIVKDMLHRFTNIKIILIVGLGGGAPSPKHDIRLGDVVADLVPDFPCLAIRGICDYADSHKNEEWQGYAAITATAYTKDLLLQISPITVHSEARLDILMETVNVLQWLTPVDFALQHHRYTMERQPGTGQWLLDTKQFRTWMIAALYSRVFFIIDALDEYQEADGSRMTFLREIIELQAKYGTSIFATSRFIPEVMQNFNGSISVELRASKGDMETYIEGHMQELACPIDNDPDLQAQIMSVISDAADGMFLLAKIYFDSLANITDRKADIATICVTYLSFSIFESGFCATDEEFEERLRSSQLYEYAVHNWGNHARNAFTSIPAVLEFLNKRSQVEASTQVLMAAHKSPGYSQNFPRKMTALHLAAYFGVENLAPLLSDMNRPSSRDSRSRTPLSYAAERGHEATVTRLLKMEAEVCREDIVDRIPLPYAAKSGPATTVEAKDDRYRTPLSYAAERGHGAVVQVLLDNMANIETMDDLYRTPLSYAAKRGHECVVRVLLNNRADIETKDDLYRTPLSYAAEKGHESVVQVLLDNRANIETKSIKNRTPLSYAAGGGYEAVVQLLLDNKASIEIKSIYNRTPLSYAVEKGHETVVQLLELHGAQHS